MVSTFKIHFVLLVGLDFHIYIFIYVIYFMVIIQRVSVVIHLKLLPTDRIRFITDRTIFAFHCLQKITPHSIKHILICNISLWCICTTWSGLYQTDNIIVTSIIDKEIFNRGELLWENQVVVLSWSIHAAPYLS